MHIISGGVTAPKGFQAAGIHCGIKDNFTTPQPEKKDLAMILSAVPCAAAGTFTRNVVKADPVILTREHLADHKAQGIIFDSGNANACAPKGMENAQRMAQAAAAATKNGRIGVIGTAATIQSDSYRSALLRINHKLEVYPQACPLFVSLVESGFVAPQDEVTRLVAQRYLSPIRAAEVDTLILGCTHYPIIAPIIGGVMGRGVTLIDSGQQAALAMAQALRERDLLAPQGSRRKADFFVTDTPQNFLNVAELFLGHSIEGRTQRIQIEKDPV